MTSFFTPAEMYRGEAARLRAMAAMAADGSDRDGLSDAARHYDALARYAEQSHYQTIGRPRGRRGEVQP